MKKIKISKKLLSLLLAAVMLFSITTGTVSADESLPETHIDEITSDIDSADLFITQEVAYYLAEFFLKDMIETEQTIWNENTYIEDMTAMYDETGDNVTGYTFKLTDGYIVVSAYLDVPNVILEWGDEAKPIYEETEVDYDDKIVYLGPLDYYIDDGSEVLGTVDGNEIPREELSNSFEEIRDIENVEEGLLEELEGLIEAPASGITTFAANNTPGGYITNPFTYAQYIHGGSWVNNNFSNNWESHANFATYHNFPIYNKQCGPVAITNIIKMYGNSYDHSTIRNSYNSDVFNEVMLANSKAGGKYFDSTNGTWRSTAKNFIVDSFDQFDVQVTVTGYKSLTYSAACTTLDASNKLMYLSMNESTSHPYGNHAVVGYAYTRVRKTDYSQYMAFIKIADGKNTAGRYVEINSIAFSGGEYLEVGFR